MYLVVTFIGIFYTYCYFRCLILQSLDHLKYTVQKPCLFFWQPMKYVDASIYSQLFFCLCSSKASFTRVALIFISSTSVHKSPCWSEQYGMDVALASLHFFSLHKNLTNLAHVSSQQSQIYHEWTCVHIQLIISDPFYLGLPEGDHTLRIFVRSFFNQLAH